MYIVHVFAHIKPDQIDAFKAATLENARNSVQEPGIARFDVLQQSDDPTRFTLVEVYRTKGDTDKHRETRHYNIWREAVESMQVEPRSKQIYENIFPAEAGWDVNHAL
jgi:(4S)-4-hydroxy-5-phosphonooxypentane-2,3-dione isomerase